MNETLKRLDIAIETAVEDLSVNGSDPFLEHLLMVLRFIRGDYDKSSI